jgi:flagellar motor switch protein FliN/FliY
MTAEQALLRLAASTAEAVRGVLDTLAPGNIVPGAVDVVPDNASPFTDVHVPAVFADVSYVDGVNGGNVLIIGVEGARRLAAAMMGMDPTAVEAGGELSELEFSAVGEAMNQMMSAAAMATAEVLGEEVEIAPPVVKTVSTVEEIASSADSAGHATAVTFSVCGAPCLLVQLVPHAFIVRMTRAFDEITASYESAPMSESLRTVSVRVWAELGRTRMPSGRVVALPAGDVVELDRDVDQPIDLYADGMRFATGRLLVTEDGGLAVRIEALLTAPVNPTTNTPMEVL